jgi:hypothetical protein
MVLQQIEGDPAVFIKGDDLAVEKRIVGKPLTGTGNLRELRGKGVFSSLPWGSF